MLDRKSLWEIFVTPVTIALVGAIGAYFITVAERKNAASIAQNINNAQASQASQLQSEELKHAKKLFIESSHLKLVKIYGNDLISCKNNLRQNALTLATLVDSKFVQKIRTLLPDCSNDSNENNEPSQEIVEQLRELYISLDSIIVKEDGTMWSTNWYFEVLLDNDIILTTKELSLDKGKTKKINGKVKSIKVRDGDSKKITIQGFRTNGKNKGLLASSKSINISVDFLKDVLVSKQINTQVIGFPDKGEFLVNISSELK